MGMLFTEVDMNTDYSRGGGHFYADRLDKIQDEISPEDLLWAGGYILCTQSTLVVNEGVVQEPPYLWKTKAAGMVQADDGVFVEGKDEPINDKLYEFLDDLNEMFYKPLYDNVLTPDCMITYTGAIFDGVSIRTYKYDGLRNMFTSKPYEKADMLTRTALSVLPELMYKRYAEPSGCFPVVFSSREEWDETLDKIIAALKLSLYNLQLNSPRNYSELVDLQNEGTALYGKYLGNL